MSSAAAAIEPVAPVERSARVAVAGGAWLLSGAMVLSGVFTYAFHVLAARTLGPAAYGQIAILWGAMFLVAVVLFRPLEQTTSRAIADRLARGEETRTVLRSVAWMFAAVLVAIGIATALFAGTIADRFFEGDKVLVVALFLGIVAYGAQYLLRGLLGGVRWFEGYGIGLIADSVARLLVAVPLLFVASRNLAAAAIVAAGIAGAFVPLALGRRRLRGIATSAAGPRFEVRRAAAFAAPASVIAGADQLFVNGAPLLVIALGGSTKAAGLVFAATMLVRAPVYVFQGLAAALLSNLTHLHATDETDKLRGTVGKTVAVLLGVGLLIVAGVATFGPRGMTTLYGPDFATPRTDLVLLGVGVALYLGASTFSQALLALDQGTRAAIAWAISAVLFVSLYAVLPGAELTRVGRSFAAATLLCATASAVILVQGTGGRRRAR